LSRLLALREAAAALDTSEASIRRWVDQGAPIARRGRRGKGGAALYDVDALKAWRGGDRGTATPDCDFLELLGAVLWAQFLATSGPHKRAIASDLAAAWHRMRWELEDRGSSAGAAPIEVERLRLIAQKMSD